MSDRSLSGLTTKRRSALGMLAAIGGGAAVFAQSGGDGAAVSDLRSVAPMSDLR